MAKIIIKNEQFSEEELLEKDISIREYGSDNKVFFEGWPNITVGKGRLEITFRGNYNEVRFGSDVIINRCVAISFIPNNKMPANYCGFYVGKRTFFNGNVSFGLGERNTKICIGEDCLFASEIKFRTSDSHTIYDVSNREKINHGGDIIIGNHVWIGAEVTFLKNSQIMDDSVVGTRSLVTKCFKEHNLCVGGGAC